MRADSDRSRIGVSSNTFKHKKPAKVLQGADGLFETIIENTPMVAVQGFSKKGKVLHWNKASEKLYGFGKKEVIGQQIQRLLLEGDSVKEFEHVLKAIWNSGKAALPREWETQTKSGEKRWVYSTMFPVSRHGKVLEVVCMDLDMTERKLLEERLSALNVHAGKLNAAKDFQQIYDLTLNAIEKTLGFENVAFMIVQGKKLKCVAQRGKPHRILGLSLEGRKKGITVRAATQGKPVVLADTKKDTDYVGLPSVRSEVAVPFEIDGKVHGVLYLESRKPNAFDQKDVELLQILASHAATAISNLEKHAEIEKRSSLLASMMRSSADMIHTTVLRQRLQKVAEAIGEYGWRRVVIRAVNENMDVANPEDLVTAGLATEESEFLWNNRVPGQVWHERFGPEFERFKIGEFYHLPWSDPWVRKRFSEGTVSSKLKQEEMIDWDPEDLLYAPLCLADGNIVGILSIDDPRDGKRPTKESLAPLELFIHQAAVAIENARLIQQLNDARSRIEEYADQLEVKVKKRTQELVEAQNKLLKSERLAAIGEIAGMVGHDLRNPLTSIAAATYYLKTKPHLGTDEKTKEMLGIIEKDIEYSNKIVNDLLDYSRDIHLELKKTTPKVIVDEALSRVRIPKKIRVVKSTLSMSRLNVDEEKMVRVFSNVIKNAVDAMPKGGKLTIRNRETQDMFEISFADTGMGMSKEVLRRIWSPLFTTKAKGMGFGLAICKRIVEAHGGTITVKTAAGKGTTFTITFPIEPKVEGGGATWVNVPESLLSMMMKA